MELIIKHQPEHFAVANTIFVVIMKINALLIFLKFNYSAINTFHPKFDAFSNLFYGKIIMEFSAHGIGVASGGERGHARPNF